MAAIKINHSSARKLTNTFGFKHKDVSFLPSLFKTTVESVSCARPWQRVTGAMSYSWPWKGYKNWTLFHGPTTEPVWPAVVFFCFDNAPHQSGFFVLLLLNRCSSSLLGVLCSGLGCSLPRVTWSVWEDIGSGITETERTFTLDNFIFCF